MLSYNEWLYTHTAMGCIFSAIAWTALAIVGIVAVAVAAVYAIIAIVVVAIETIAIWILTLIYNTIRFSVALLFALLCLPYDIYREYSRTRTYRYYYNAHVRLMTKQPRLAMEEDPDNTSILSTLVGEEASAYGSEETATIASEVTKKTEES
ncbi:hypothetical protein OE88DRAFT_1736534 [Heliocybe sulcata]|uniref:Uncharacterized protein n=1 Tax=Heliocybe sulcata TaxID=5364 RepID=A0A5C3MWX4_9AGAM|nr:hypothetical protein OE88DRAFT_1736534 [Heliocybe sulcata]